jgi:hypothetical protein
MGDHDSYSDSFGFRILIRKNTSEKKHGLS